MIDPVGAGMDALWANSPLAPAALFTAGLLTSAGPCVAPRYVALAALAGGRARAGVIAAFIAGVVGTYVAIGYAAEQARLLLAHGRSIDAALAVALFASGIATLAAARPEGSACEGGRSHGGPLLLGAASSLIVSPCCTPMLAAIAAAPGIGARPMMEIVLLAAFGLGHALPLVLAGYGPGAFVRVLRRLGAAQAPGIVSGSMMIALGAYYGMFV